MKIETNKRTDAPNFKLEEKDSSGVLDLRRLMAGKFICDHCNKENSNFAWQTLQGYFSTLRLWIEELGKSHAQSRSKKDLCSNDLSILTGIDLAIGLPQKLILQDDVMARVAEHKNMGDQNDDAGTNEYGD